MLLKLRVNMLYLKRLFFNVFITHNDFLQRGIYNQKRLAFNCELAKCLSCQNLFMFDFKIFHTGLIRIHSPVFKAKPEGERPNQWRGG